MGLLFSYVFSTLVPKANAWLHDNQFVHLIKCETLEKKISSVDEVTSDGCMFIPKNHHAIYVKGLRWVSIQRLVLCEGDRSRGPAGQHIHTLQWYPIDDRQRATNKIVGVYPVWHWIELNWMLLSKYASVDTKVNHIKCTKIITSRLWGTNTYPCTKKCIIQ